MAQQTQPNPVQFWEAAVPRMRQYLAAVKPSQLNDPTPCSEWNVKALVDHIVQGTEMMGSIIGGTASPAAPAGSGIVASFDAAVAKLRQAAGAPGALQKSYTTPWGAQMTGAELMGGAFLDAVVHGWDLAKASGQATQMDPKLAEACYAMFAPAAPQLRQQGVVGPEVKIAARASIQDKLLGTMGRKP